MKPSIKSLKNPSLSDKAAFETSPFIEYIFFTNYARNAIMQPTIPSLVQVSPFAALSSTFTVTPASLAASTPLNSIQWLTLTLGISTQSTVFNQVKTGTSYTVIELAETTGISTLYECVFVLNTGLGTQIGCEVTGTKTLRIGNLYSATATTNWVVYIRAKIQAASFTFTVNFNQMLYSSATSTWSSLTVWTFTSTAASITTTSSAFTLA